MSEVICPDCGAPMRLRVSDKYLDGLGRPRKFYGCSRYPKCKAAHGAHPDGRPLGTPANAELRARRRLVHDTLEQFAFDHGQSEIWARKQLSKAMAIKAFHVSELDDDGCTEALLFMAENRKR